MRSTRISTRLAYQRSWGPPVGSKQSPVYSYFPIFKMVIISAASLMQKDVWHVPLTSHTGLFYPGHSPYSSSLCSYGPNSWASNEKPFSVSASPLLCPPGLFLPAQRTSPTAAGLYLPSQDPHSCLQQENSLPFLPQVPFL